jgi:hypothetical protein
LWRIADERTLTPVTGWLDGWVGGVIAASVTVVATFWWDTWIRRRTRLDDAVAALSAAAWDFGNTAARMQNGPRVPDEEMTSNFRALALALLEVQGHAFRPLLGSSRGMARTVKALADNLAELHRGDLTPPAWDWPQMMYVCAATQAACYAWMHNPRSFRRRADRSREFLDRIEKPDSGGVDADADE